MLEITGLRKYYEQIRALESVSLTVEPGQLLGFLGPNGAGKTTTMRSVFGLVKPDAGTITWKGNPITQQDRLRFGYMPEERGLYPRMRNQEQVAYFGMLHGLSRPIAEASAASWLRQLGLGDRANDRMEELSHGNQQRLQLAAALVHSPELLVLDEPFAGLDPVGVSDMGRILAEQASQGTAVVFSSHQLDLVEDLCDDVVIINEGSLALSGAVAKLRAEAPYRHVVVEVDQPQGDWTEDFPDAEVVRRQGSRVVLDVSRGVDLGQMLAAAQRSGRVVEFTFEPPSLNEVFLRAVGS